MLNSLMPPTPPYQPQNQFAAIKDQVYAAIKARMDKNLLPPDPSGYTLLEGIINMPIQQELKGVVIGGPAIPTVAVIGNSTGIVVTFALKAILPNVNI